jgi:prophage regulatory protein
MNINFWRLQDVEASQGGLKKSAVYARVSTGLLPRPVSLGGNAVAWLAHEIQAVNAARVAGKSDDEVRTLVARLHEQRTATA